MPTLAPNKLTLHRIDLLLSSGGILRFHQSKAVGSNKKVNKMANRKHWLGLVVCCTISLSLAGCQNRFKQPCANPYQQFPQQYQQNPYQYGYNGNPNLNVARGGLIAPPPTGSLNIPSIARNNLPGSNQGLLNTNRQAPTLPNRAAQYNQQNGWRSSDGSPQSTSNPSNNPPNRPVGGQTFGSNNGSPNNGSPNNAPASATSVLVQNTQANPNRVAQNQPYYQPQNTAATGYGSSSVQSPDYATTAVNESFDRTRLPVSDASNVRAPSQYYSRATGAQTAQVAQLPPGSQFGNQQYYSPQQQQPFYTGTFANTRPALSPQIVQSQSTAQYDAYGGTSRSADWRNRDDSITGSFQ